MKRKTEYCLLVLFLICGMTTLAQPDRSKFNDNWQFKLDSTNAPNDEGLAKALWRDVQLPHDWSIELNFDESSPSGNRGASLRGGTAQYRKYFS